MDWKEDHQQEAGCGLVGRSPTGNPEENWPSTGAGAVLKSAGGLDAAGGLDTAGGFDIIR